MDHTAMSVEDKPNVDDIHMPLIIANMEFLQNTTQFRMNSNTDVLITAYPRSGTTLTIQIVTLLMSDPNKLQKMNEVPIGLRAPFIELTIPDSSQSEIERFLDMPPPRFAKTHLPVRFVKHLVNDDKVKTVVCLRNPKDAMVSYFYFHKINSRFGLMDITWNEFFDLCMTEKQAYGDLVSWMCDWWSQRHKHNVLILNYEDLVTDKREQITKIAAFLDRNLDEEHISKVHELSSFSEMKNNKATNYKDRDAIKKTGDFIRKGEIGQWKNHFTVTQNEIFDRKYQTMLDKVELSFRWV